MSGFKVDLRSACLEGRHNTTIPSVRRTVAIRIEAAVGSFMMGSVMSSDTFCAYQIGQSLKQGLKSAKRQRINPNPDCG
jgi:hypothetical protein